MPLSVRHRRQIAWNRQRSLVDGNFRPRAAWEPVLNETRIEPETCPYSKKMERKGAALGIPRVQRSSSSFHLRGPRASGSEKGEYFGRIEFEIESLGTAKRNGILSEFRREIVPVVRPLSPPQGDRAALCSLTRFPFSQNREAERYVSRAAWGRVYERGGWLGARAE